ncbi:hypothetical protein GCK72_015624 [Caenorhabditis remanei]|uniref:C2H2-type domain-containing protein n=1 Tax=Caenorhabditis remanei TaxID=31234 RepID=A0A6A5GXP5_CAERE|nr:hypothetical protein GCK72_015624 [Caenorhabditis remanei]KAF1759163.1 hypothetical protein GCK72_015624 [Caenorhabditis remanei]
MEAIEARRRQVPNLGGVGAVVGAGQVRVYRVRNLIGRHFLQCPYCLERVRSERQYNAHLEACFALHQ